MVEFLFQCRPIDTGTVVQVGLVLNKGQPQVPLVFLDICFRLFSYIAYKRLETMIQI